MRPTRPLYAELPLWALALGLSALLVSSGCSEDAPPSEAEGTTPVELDGESGSAVQADTTLVLRDTVRVTFTLAHPDSCRVVSYPADSVEVSDSTALVLINDTKRPLEIDFFPFAVKGWPSGEARRPKPLRLAPAGNRSSVTLVPNSGHGTFSYHPRVGGRPCPGFVEDPPKVIIRN